MPKYYSAGQIWFAQFHDFSDSLFRHFTPDIVLCSSLGEFQL